MNLNKIIHRRSPRINVTWLILCLAVTIAFTTTCIIITRLASSSKYLGTWNYTQPNESTDVNIAHLNNEDYSRGVPQIGTVTFYRDSSGNILGHTDQGCTWRFAPKGSSLELATPNQFCYNRVAGLSYNIYKWSVRVDGNHETEILRATSYLPTGTFDFVLQKGERTKSIEPTEQNYSNIIGKWQYEPADMHSQFNIVTSVQLSTDKAPVIGHYAQKGTIQYKKDGDGNIVATMDDGCHWTLMLKGNTTELSSAPQTCKTRNGTKTLNFFAAASSNNEQYSMLSGIDEEHTIFLLIIGKLVKVL